MSAAAVELLAERGGNHLSVVPDMPSVGLEPGTTREAIFPGIPPELFIGDPLPVVVSEAYFRDVIDPADYGFERWELDKEEPAQPRWIQISSRTLRQPPRDSLDPVRLYELRSVMANGNRTLYEAETALTYVDGWASNRQDYVPTGVVRISSFSSAVDESAEDAPVMDAASVLFAYDAGGTFSYASMLRSAEGTHRGSRGEVPSAGDIVSFAALTEKKKKPNKQLALDGFAAPVEPKEEEDLPILPSVRIEGANAVMRHYGKVYQSDGNTVLQVVEVHAPSNVAGLAALIREQGEYEDDKSNDDAIQTGQGEQSQDFMPMTEVFKAAVQFPVSIETKIIPVRS